MVRPRSNQTLQDAEQIRVVLRKHIDAWTPGSLRPLAEPKLLVRCSLSRLEDVSLIAAHISPEGLQRLQAHQELQMELRTPWSRLIFVTHILGNVGDEVTFSLPETLTVVEERQASRFGNAQVNPLRVQFTSRRVGDADKPQEVTPDTLSVIDISVGGLGVETTSQELMDCFRDEGDGFKMLVHIPNSLPWSVPCQLRWVEPAQTQGAESLMFGLAFLEPSRDFMLALGRYLKSLKDVCAVL